MTDIVYCDYTKGLLFIPKALFETHQTNLIPLISNFMFFEKEEQIVIHTPLKIAAKLKGDLYYNEKLTLDGTSCTYCEKRIACMLEDYKKCTGFTKNENLNIDLTAISDYFTTNDIETFAVKAG
jgi:hypothetical protein